jgi:glucose/mannose transport system permease protein
VTAANADARATAAAMRGARGVAWLRPAELARVALLVLCALYFLFPVYVLVTTAFKPMHEIRLGNMLLPPAAWTTEGVVKAWSDVCIGGRCGGLSPYFWNSVRIAVPAVVLSVLLGALNGYALTKWRLPGAHLFFGLLIAGNFLPYQMVLLPMAITLSRLGLFGSYEGLIIVHVVYGLPITTLLFRNFFLGVPDEIVKAARIDGAGFFGLFIHVMLPIAVPMLAVAVVLQFTGIWNDFLFALVFGGRDFPMTVALNNLINTQFGDKEYNVNMGGVLLTALPTLMVYVFAGKWFMRGLAAGAVKG